MMDFLGYSLFSGFEYMATLFLTFSCFKLDYRASLKEILTVSAILVGVTYAIIVTNLTNIIPIPLIMLLCFVLMLMKILGSHRWKYSLVVSIGGLLMNLVLQIVVLLIFLHSGAVSEGNLQNGFSSEAFTIQTVYSSVAIAIGVYTKIFGNGFGFMLRKGKALNFLITSTSLFVIIFLGWISLNLSAQWSLFIMLGVVAAVALSIIFVLSYKRDNFEYA